MEPLLFPFEKVNRDSKIIIYGFGDAGRQYLLQIKKTNYCEIIFVVDKGYKKMKNYFMDVFSPEKVFLCPKEEYDYIVVAINELSRAELIKKMLIDKGIEETKIIIAPDRGVGDFRYSEMYPDISLDKIDEDEGFLDEYLKTFFFFNRAIAWESYDYYPQLYKMLNEKREDTRTLPIIKKALRVMEPSLEKLVFFRLIYDLEIFDSECMQMFMQTITDMEWTDDTPYIAIMDAGHMVHKGIAKKCIYPDFYVDRRNHLKKICEYYNLKPGVIKNKSKDRRVAIIAFSMNDISDDPVDKRAIEYASEFIGENYNVKIFVLNTLRQANKNDSCCSKKYPYSSMLQSEFDDRGYNFDAFFAEKESVEERLSEIIDAVFDYNPAFIVDMSDEFCPQSYIFQQFYLTLYVPFRVGMSSSFFDYILIAGDTDFYEKNRIYNCVDSKKLLNVKLNSLPKDKNVKYDRKAFGFDKNDFIIVSVGTRLNYELDDKLKAAMCELLITNPNMKWVLVGDIVESSEILFNDLIKGKRIVNHGFEMYLDALYGICDIYLQPDRNGGGISVRQAMRKGLPVIILDRMSDARKLFNTDDLCGDIDEMMEKIKKLYLDSNSYEKCSNHMREIIEKLQEKNNAQKIIETMQERQII